MASTERTENSAVAYTVVSRHSTSQGYVTWVRCNSCSQLRMLLHPYASSGTIMSAGQHTSRCPVCD